MSSEDIINKNIDLSTEFSRYVMEHPEFAEKIPDDAVVVLLPEYDPELCEANLALARQRKGSEQPIVYVRIEKLKAIKSRIVNPRIELEEEI